MIQKQFISNVGMKMNRARQTIVFKQNSLSSGDGELVRIESYHV